LETREGEEMKKFGEILKNFLLDLPYNVADIKYSLKKAIQPDYPFNEQDWSTEYTPRKPTFKELLSQSLEADRYTPTQSDSAKVRPLMLPPSKSDVDTKALLTQFGFRPKAIDYLSKIPVKVGNNYVSERAIGTSYPEPRFIGVTPEYSNNSDVLIHEYLHQAPRIIPNKFADLLYKQNQEDKQKYTRRWGKQYMSKPGKMTEERFAQRDLPSGFYKHIFQQ